MPLFRAGIGLPAAELGAAAGERKLKLSRAAPGIFFALFGAAVVAMTIYKGLNVELPGVVNETLGRPRADPPPWDTATGPAEAPPPLVLLAVAIGNAAAGAGGNALYHAGLRTLRGGAPLSVHAEVLGGIPVVTAPVEALKLV